jgi:hypothetical protein
MVKIVTAFPMIKMRAKYRRLGSDGGDDYEMHNSTVFVTVDECGRGTVMDISEDGTCRPVATREGFIKLTSANQFQE